jgi:hypothetical protein
MSGQFLISAIPEIRLFTHSFALDTILAGLADSAFYSHRFFSADHTSLAQIIHLFFTSASTMNVSLITGLSSCLILIQPRPQFTILICAGVSRITSKPY